MPESDNGRVTLAVLNTNLEHLITEVAGLRSEVVDWRADHERRIRMLEAWCHRSTERWLQHDRDHKELKQELNAKRLIGDGVTALSAAVAAVVGVFVKP